MAERRQATRREPIEIEIQGDDRVFVAEPLPWIQANDLGGEIVKQNADAFNHYVQMYVDEDSGLPQLEAQLKKKLSDWNAVLRMAYPNVDDKQWTEPRVLSLDECADLVLAALDVNHLEHIKHLVDPNSPTPMLDGGISTSTSGEDGQKTTSTPDSGSVDSPEPTPLPSPAER